jgi:two-component system invasion response regulator UvrY
MTKIRTIAIDDEPLILSMMQELVEDDPDVEISAITENNAEFLDMIAKEQFDVALMDISVGGREGGLELLKALQSHAKPPACIILSAHDEIDYAPRCLTLGAKGYVNKSRIVTELIEGIQKVKAGNLFVSGPNSNYILNQFNKPKA